jgi:cytochrome P450
MRLKTQLRQAYGLGRIGALLAMERLLQGVVYLPFGKRYHADPYPAYRKLRERDPVHRSHAIPGWVFTRYDDVEAILREPRFSNDTNLQPNSGRAREELIAAGLVDPAEPRVLNLLELDPPEHTRLRTLVGKAFTPRAIEALRPRAVQIVEEQLDAVAGNREMDLMADFASPLPVIMIAEMLGLPVEDRAQLKLWSDDMARSVGSPNFDDLAGATRAGNEFRAYLAGLVEERRKEPRDDLLSTLLAVEEEGDRLTEREVFMLIGLLMVAGNETTTNLIGNGTVALLRNPDEFAKLRDDPGLVTSAVEELVRYDSPVQVTVRFVKEEMTFAGQVMKRHQLAAVVLGAANRDPEHFDEPDRLDLARLDNRHLAFGHGTHFCLGSQLARMEAQVAFEAIATRLPDLKLADDPLGSLDWGDNVVLRGLRSLPVRF